MYMELCIFGGDVIIFLRMNLRNGHDLWWGTRKLLHMADEKSTGEMPLIKTVEPDRYVRYGYSSVGRA